MIRVVRPRKSERRSIPWAKCTDATELMSVFGLNWGRARSVQTERIVEATARSGNSGADHPSSKSASKSPKFTQNCEKIVLTDHRLPCCCDGDHFLASPLLNLQSGLPLLSTSELGWLRRASGGGH